MCARVLCALQSLSIRCRKKCIPLWVYECRRAYALLHTQKNALNFSTYQMMAGNCIRKSRSWWIERAHKKIRLKTLLQAICVPFGGCTMRTIKILGDFDTRCQRYCKSWITRVCVCSLESISTYVTWRSKDAWLRISMTRATHIEVGKYGARSNSKRERDACKQLRQKKRELQ